MPFLITEFDYGSAIRYIAKMVGHPTPVDPAGSTDPAVQQMGTAVNHALGELLSMNEWQDITKRSTISIFADAPGQKEKAFALPVDFLRFIDNTQWSEQSFLPAPGPISPQGWQTSLIQSIVPAMQIFWQVRDDKLYVLAPPVVPINFSFFYLSRGQVIDQDDPTLLKNVASKNGDKFKLDGYLIMLLGRMHYLEWKGFDASAATRDFQIAYNERAGADKGASVLSIGGSGGMPLISPYNIPITGYGV